MKLISVKSAAGVSSVVLCVAASLALFAQDTPAKAPDVEYTATGTFSTPQVSGQDVFQLAGNAFAMSVVANAATVPTTHGAKWATYTKLTMSGAVSSALFPTPFAISSSNTSIELAMGNPSYDVFALFSPITVLGKPIYITTAPSNAHGHSNHASDQAVHCSRHAQSVQRHSDLYRPEHGRRDHTDDR